MSTTKPKPAVSPHKKPANLSEVEWQRELRKQFVAEAKGASFVIKHLGGEHPVFADYVVENPVSHGRYKVALRTAQPGSPNFCSCMDFKTNRLGTCKHIEAILRHIQQDQRLAKLLGDDYQPTYSSMFLQYGPEREVRLRIGQQHQEEYRQLAGAYFDDTLALRPEAYDHIDQFLTEAAHISPDFRCYPDAMDFIIATRETRTRHALIERQVTDEYLDGLLKTSLYSYQKEGILFAARAGRCLIADDMGLGKTIQAIGAAEFFKTSCGIGSVLIICPTSLKYQWKSEIEKFTDSSVAVIEGDYPRRHKQYAEGGALYTIMSYNVATADVAEIAKLAPDLVILDEAQRIKNWQTKTAQAVKKIDSTYTIVLTGTPIENKLEELYSIVQFIDPFRLGPLYRFLSGHQIRDESGKVTGYKDLNQIHELLADIVIRRTKKSVLAQLPSRTDKTMFVPLTKEQADIHAEYGDIVARLVAKWKHFGFLDEKDRQRLMLALSCMRMVSDSTYILDQETRFDTKITELMCILDDVFAANEEKVVVFSQWERMTRLVGAELDKRGVGYAYLHGGVPSRDRKTLLDDFRDDPACRVFLSTDAGSVGLNLQSASLLVNLDLPWNPAVLEQRIGRIYRHGQKRNVNIINFVSRQSIEERMLDVLAFKSSLFAGVLDNGSDQVFMGESKFKRFMQSVEEVSGAPEAQPATTDVEDVPDAEDMEGASEEAGEVVSTPSAATPSSAPTSSEPATQFLNAAGAFFDTLSQTLADPAATQQLVASLTEKDTSTGKTYLKIPVESEHVLSGALGALAGLLSALKR
jgi:superfamily II DNA/RNA helicase